MRNKIILHTKENLKIQSWDVSSRSLILANGRSNLNNESGNGLSLLPFLDFGLDHSVLFLVQKLNDRMIGIFLDELAVVLAFSPWMPAVAAGFVLDTRTNCLNLLCLGRT